jgi:hypothetical protein
MKLYRNKLRIKSKAREKPGEKKRIEEEKSIIII